MTAGVWIPKLHAKAGEEWGSLIISALDGQRHGASPEQGRLARIDELCVQQESCLNKRMEEQ